MYHHRDILALTRITVGLLWAHMILNALFGVSSFYVNVLSPQPPIDVVSDGFSVVALLYLGITVATFIVVGRWIYRASVNAHAISEGMEFTPGAAVGWYFVPLANLVKPFQAMKEIWLVSHYGSHWEQGDAPDLMNWWWGLWILTNILGSSVEKRISPDLVGWLDLAGGLLHIPLNLIFINILEQIKAGQNLTVHQEIFA